MIQSDHNLTTSLQFMMKLIQFNHNRIVIKSSINAYRTTLKNMFV